MQERLLKDVYEALRAGPKWQQTLLFVAYDDGGGFYDRTLERLRAEAHAPAIGFAFSAQRAGRLPREATDQPLDAVVTEEGQAGIASPSGPEG